MDLKLKLNKINELDDQILNMNFQKKKMKRILNYIKSKLKI